MQERNYRWEDEDEGRGRCRHLRSLDRLDLEVGEFERRFLVHLANVPMLQENPADAMRSRLVRRVPKDPPTAAELRVAAQEETDAFMASCEAELAPLYAQLLAQQSWGGSIMIRMKSYPATIQGRMFDITGPYSYELRCLGVAQNGEVRLDSSGDWSSFEPFCGKLTRVNGKGVLRWWEKGERCKYTATLTEHGLEGTCEDRITEGEFELTPSQ